MELLQSSSADELLRRFLGTPDEAESARLLDSLLANHAAHIINPILYRKLRSFQATNSLQFAPEDFEDLQAECLFNLVKVLRDLKENPDGKVITDFRAYVAVTAYNECAKFWRSRVQQYERLKNKIKYMLHHEPAFNLWQDEAKTWWCALAQNEIGPAKVERAHILSLVRKHHATYAQAHPLDLVTAIFAQAGGALRLSGLIGIVAELWGIQDLPDRSLDQMKEAGVEASELLDARSLFELRVDLASLWEAIHELPPRQRSVILYTLQDTDGHEMLTAFFDTGVAHMQDLARALNINEDEILALLSSLPLADAALAQRLQLTSQQVYNLRKSARDFLRRRLAGKQRRKRQAG
jgi:DNA-directed RNA polymerase specialized sigma24 family protein